MISARRFSTLAFGVVIATSLIYSQEVKSSAVKMIYPRLRVIQALELQTQPFLGPWPRVDLGSAPPMAEHDLSRYREFQFGMNLPAVAKMAGLKPSAARLIHQRPAVIQELQWRPQGFLVSSAQADSVKEILFSFYNGELFRIVVNYDRYKTEGLTTEDMVEAISAQYGTATKPEAEIIFSSSKVYNDSEVIIARWEDSQYSFNLFRSSYTKLLS
jgi:hypothetical protein